MLEIPNFEIPKSEQYLALQAMLSRMNTNIVPPPQQFTNTIAQLKVISDRCNEIFSKIRDTVSQLSTTFGPAIFHLQFISRVAQAGWPLFTLNDEGLERRILVLLDDESDDAAEELARFVGEIYDSDYWEKRFEKWKQNPVINKERIPVLEEAIKAHTTGMYYSAVSIFACQIDGLIEDIYKAGNLADLAFSEKQHESLCNFFHIEESNYNLIKNREKGHLLQSYMYCDSGFLLWRHFIMYLKDTILSSSKNADLWKRQPLRNKICHGEQLNYGTSEHSLKSLLCIDCLMRYANNVMLGLQDNNDLGEEI